MSYTDVEVYEDPILKLARDPNLNKEKEKTSQLIHIIHNFPLTERKVSKLCQLSLTILQSLEKIELNLKNWAFLSLDINSTDHFNESYSSDIKNFNNNLSIKVLSDCQELNIKINKISFDLDYVTRSTKSLHPLEFISDSGSLLTSLTLRNIKLKDELTDKITVSYSKAKLITIGTDLELMLEDNSSAETASTVISYKKFVISLLRQLNVAIENNDNQEKYECLTVIADMEQMYEVFKLERVQQSSMVATGSPKDAKSELELDDFNIVDDYHPEPNHNSQEDDEEYDDDFNSEFEGSSSIYGSSVYNPPMVHSITRSQQLQPAAAVSQTPHSPSIDSPNSSVRSPKKSRRNSLSSLATTNVLHKSTISEELPYLMTAFNSAKNFEEDIHHYKQEEEKESPKKHIQKERSRPPSVAQSVPNLRGTKHFPSHKPILPDSQLYSESTILPKSSFGSASSYLYANNSLLSKLGIRPQIITTDLPKELSNNTSSNIATSTLTSIMPKKGIKNHEEVEDNHQLVARKFGKENRILTPLTKANLDSHISDLAVDTQIDDYVE